MTKGALVKSRKLPPKFIDVRIGSLGSKCLFIHWARSAKSPSETVLSENCSHTPPRSWMHGICRKSHAVWMQWRTPNVASICGRQRRKAHLAGKSRGPKQLAAKTIIGGPKAVRNRLIRKPNARKNNDCTTKKSNAASSLHSSTAPRSGTLLAAARLEETPPPPPEGSGSAAVVVLAPPLTALRFRSPGSSTDPTPEAGVLVAGARGFAATAPTSSDGLLASWTRKQPKKTRITMSPQATRAAGPAVVSLYNFNDSFSKMLKTPMMRYRRALKDGSAHFGKREAAKRSEAGSKSLTTDAFVQRISYTCVSAVASGSMTFRTAKKTTTASKPSQTSVARTRIHDPQPLTQEEGLLRWAQAFPQQDCRTVRATLRPTSWNIKGDVMRYGLPKCKITAKTSATR
mmetsp:Transcript_86394/g.241672  ORF Transcript_86394/g.241672 Transcript_86394/m.241672 type:complete len:401 (+) Transcript_86394:1204-2406(+)